jgi:hypothetical protein
MTHFLPFQNSEFYLLRTICKLRLALDLNHCSFAPSPLLSLRLLITAHRSNLISISLAIRCLAPKKHVFRNRNRRVDRTARSARPRLFPIYIVFIEFCL